MPRRHPHTYRRPKPLDELRDLEHVLDPDEPAVCSRAVADPIWPLIAVIALVIFGLGVIAFLFALRTRSCVNEYSGKLSYPAISSMFMTTSSQPETAKD